MSIRSSVIKENNANIPTFKSEKLTSKLKDAPAAILKGIPLPNGITFNKKVRILFKFLQIYLATNKIS